MARTTELFSIKVPVGRSRHHFKSYTTPTLINWGPKKKKNKKTLFFFSSIREINRDLRPSNSRLPTHARVLRPSGN